MNKDNNRLAYLDSLRGIAAMMVLIYHYIGWKWGDEKSYHFASIVFNGSDAVSFFFVLSGFVLSYKYLQNNQELLLKEYLTKRIFRIFPAYILAVLLMFFYYHRNDTILMNIKELLYKNTTQIWEELFLTHNYPKV
jgi:peptidoglycan/LPS O-acetylase OafA/YrhL